MEQARRDHVNPDISVTVPTLPVAHLSTLVESSKPSLSATTPAPLLAQPAPAAVPEKRAGVAASHRPPKRKRTGTSTISSPSASPKKRTTDLPSYEDRADKEPISTGIFPHSDRLGTLVDNLSTALLHSPSWSSFVEQMHGPPHLKPDLQDIPHPAGAYLAHLREHGVPVIMCTEPLSPEQLKEQLDRGCHKSAQNHADFVRDEMADFVESGYWLVLPYDLIKDLPGLRLSPLGVKEERERRHRLVVDHTFFLVNRDTVPLAPKEAMQFGAALPRILYLTRHADPKYGVPHIAKYDVKDGFYKMHLHPNMAQALATIMPRYPNEPQLVAIPTVLTMGWISSPPTFSALTETICDITNDRLYRKHAPPHRLDPIVEPLDEK